MSRDIKRTISNQSEQMKINSCTLSKKIKNLNLSLCPDLLPLAYSTFDNICAKENGRNFWRLNFSPFCQTHTQKLFGFIVNSERIAYFSIGTMHLISFSQLVKRIITVPLRIKSMHQLGNTLHFFLASISSFSR